MNARVYNALLGVFLSVDAMNQMLSDTQTGNGYSYARNNPLKFIDPSGNEWCGSGWGCKLVTNPTDAMRDVVNGIGHALNEAGKWLSENWRTVVIVAVVIVVTWATAGAGTPEALILSGMEAGATAGALGAALYGGSFDDVIAGATKGAVIG